MAIKDQSVQHLIKTITKDLEVSHGPLLVTSEGSRISTSMRTGSSQLVRTSVSEDGRVIKEIQATHAHDARSRNVDVTPVLAVVRDILQRANLSSDAAGATKGDKELAADALQEKLGAMSVGPKGTMLEALAVDIQKVCCEFSCKCSGGDFHASTIGVLNMLGNYSWDAKVAITLAAFAVTYGELWLVILLGLANHPMAKSIAVLKQTPELSEIHGVLEPQLATLNDLLLVVQDVANTLAEFSSLPSKYITLEDAPLATSMNHIAVAAYWSIRSVIVCGAKITSNIGITSGLVGSATEAWDLSSLTHKVTSKLGQLRQKLSLCYEHIELKKMDEAYKNLVRIYQTSQMDNLKFLKALIYSKDDLKTLHKISYKNDGGVPETLQDFLHRPNADEVKVERLQVDVLKGKTVLFLVSDLDVSEEELSILDKFYKESRRKEELQYEVVWLPVVDQMSKENEDKFIELRSRMVWYTLLHPSLLDDVSKKFIREYFGFSKKLKIVAVDPFGKEASRDVFHLILIWGNLAYPFTKVKEEELWKKNETTSKLDLLLSSVFPDYNKWATQSNTYVCFFGGEDIEWIRKFTTSMREQATKNGLKIALIYIGKPNSKEATKRIIKMITSEKIAYTLPNVTTVTYFWTRLESMHYTRMQYVQDTLNTDNIIKQTMSLLCFGSGHDGFSGFSKPGATDIILAKGDYIVAGLSKPEFAQQIPQLGVIGSLRVAIETFPVTGYHCNQVAFPFVEGGGVLTRVICTDCLRPMEKYLLYKCCTG